MTTTTPRQSVPCSKSWQALNAANQKPGDGVSSVRVVWTVPAVSPVCIPATRPHWLPEMPAKLAIAATIPSFTECDGVSQSPGRTAGAEGRAGKQ